MPKFCVTCGKKLLNDDTPCDVCHAIASADEQLQEVIPVDRDIDIVLTDKRLIITRDLMKYYSFKPIIGAMVLGPIGNYIGIKQAIKDAPELSYFYRSENIENKAIFKIYLKNISGIIRVKKWWKHYFSIIDITGKEVYRCSLASVDDKCLENLTQFLNTIVKEKTGN
jgi:hypothetical protein